MGPRYLKLVTALPLAAERVQKGGLFTVFGNSVGKKVCSMCQMVLLELITLMCLSIGTPKNNKFSICSKWKIHYF